MQARSTEFEFMMFKKPRFQKSKINRLSFLNTAKCEDYLTISPSLKGSPHSGQNFGGFLGSSGVQPHLSQR